MTHEHAARYRKIGSAIATTGLFLALFVFAAVAQKSLSQRRTAQVAGCNAVNVLRQQLNKANARQYALLMTARDARLAAGTPSDMTAARSYAHLAADIDTLLFRDCVAGADHPDQAQPLVQPGPPNPDGTVPNS